MSYLTGLARFTTLAAQGTQMPAGPSQPAQPVPAAGRRKRVARGIILAWFFRWPLDRRFWHLVAMLAIAAGSGRAGWLGPAGIWVPCAARVVNRARPVR